VVESTYNWYWLVDGLMERGHRVHVANTAAIEQYSGLQYTDDDSDARWLAQLLRLGVLPQGYIYPKEQRPVRDLLRKRSQLVRYRTANLLSIQNLFTRNTGQSMSANQIKGLQVEEIDGIVPANDLALAIKANLSVMRSAEEQLEVLEQTVTGRVKLRPEFRFLKSVPGIGPIRADHHAGDRRHPQIFYGGELRFVLPVCGQPETFQRQTQRQRQHQERE
jgi:transposase